MGRGSGGMLGGGLWGPWWCAAGHPGLKLRQSLEWRKSGFSAESDKGQGAVQKLRGGDDL